MNTAHRRLRKLRFYIAGFAAYWTPQALTRHGLPPIKPGEREEAMRRVAYYNRMPLCRPQEDWISVADYKFPFKAKHRQSAYFFDLLAVTRHFPPSYRFARMFGDVTDEPPSPAFVKSRPVKGEGESSNSVLLKLDGLRHFVFVRDTVPFEAKRDMMVSRNKVRQPWRQRLLEMYCGHPLCNVGQINTDTLPAEHPEWLAPRLSIEEQLRYKFVCCIEGNDVATNLKWVMSSNSLAVMPRPRYETWFMEGSLIPGYHYVEIKPDYSDLPDKLAYYIAQPDEAKAIISHAHEHVAQFLDKRRESLIALLTAARYFERSGQSDS